MDAPAAPKATTVVAKQTANATKPERKQPAESLSAPADIAPAAATSQKPKLAASGVSEYKDTRIPSLRYAGKDARSFYDWLVSPEGGKYSISRVRLLIDGDATENGIRNSLFEWLGQALEQDVVTIFFAGHGSPQSPDNPENLFLLRGLKGEADDSKDRRITLGEIVPYLSEQVRRATGNAQSPTVAGRFDPALTIGK